MEKWRIFSFCYHTESNLQTLLRVLLQDQRSYSVWISSSHFVPHAAMSSLDTSFLSYSRMPDAFHFCRVTWACKALCWTFLCASPFIITITPFLAHCAASVSQHTLLLQLIMSICAQGLCAIINPWIRIPSPNTYLLSSPLNAVNSCLSAFHLSP